MKTILSLILLLLCGGIVQAGETKITGAEISTTTAVTISTLTVTGSATFNNASSTTTVSNLEMSRAFKAANLTTAQRDALGACQNGWIVYNTTTSHFNFCIASDWSQTP